ncbi:hypothetical protein Snoj_01500 [Streptomyces nojiriensis]|uniref:Integral membrane protein n=1 Tax=Streptomyces nojiriensis TaxID=66374 RepID=A0ABQ3SDT9_9ACTN|nr:hypothetical protein [Streptomyces nojiriensis]QTI42368.1 hypothetical protein JYK04_00125 [Streptomyces nojiriensis]GGS32643.1 hypothetical protein GCM10010205_73560 [Streptomyces nojiriensis]GHI66232.1 hypothetical protein Snoj_01500 [Streptomyces nojiriensis]
MTTYDAQTALDAIHHRQEQTLDGYMRHAGSRPQLIVSTLGLFAVCSSFDLPSPWKTAAVLVGNALVLGGLFVYKRRAPVRRKATGPEVLVYAAVGVLLLVLFWAVAIGAYFLHLSARHTLAAAVTVLAIVAVSYALRPFVETIVRGNGQA